MIADLTPCATAAIACESEEARHQQQSNRAQGRHRQCRLGENRNPCLGVAGGVRADTDDGCVFSFLVRREIAELSYFPLWLVQ